MELLKSRFAKGHYVYAITVAGPGDRALVRIGASSDLKARLRGYPVLDLIPESQISWWVVSDAFVKDLEPILRSHFGDGHEGRPRHLVGKPLDYCVRRELNSIEYKVERLLLEEYRKKHGCLPPGNPRTGSARAYLEQVTVAEDGPVQILDKPCARLPSVHVDGDQLLKLLW